MRHITLAALGLALLGAGCATKPARLPVAPEPPLVLESVECSELGAADLASFGKLKFDRVPYGWARARVDVERGVVVKVEVLDSSPKGMFDAETIALLKSMHHPSLASARGCFWSHRWD